MLKRKNLIVNEEKTKALADRLRTSESEAIRQAVERTLTMEEAAEEAMTVIQRLHARGTVRDVSGRLPDEGPDDE